MAVNLKASLIVFTFIALVAVIATLGTLLSISYSKDNSNSVGDETKDLSNVWGYKCEDKICKKVEITNENIKDLSSINVCRLTCANDIGTLWPKPKGNVTFSQSVVTINPNRVTYTTNNFRNDPDNWLNAWQRFRDMLFQKIPYGNGTEVSLGKPVLVEISVNSDNMALTYDTYEGYRIRVSEAEQEVYVFITAENFYGSRHALETLSQLIVYDEFNNSAVLIKSVDIQDEPTYKHRGISMDTSRNFYPLDVLKRTINGLAMVKMNVFHWHMTDSQSMPMELKSHPEITRLGAYSPDKVYSSDDIKEIVKYARARGVIVIPEFDSPSHVGEGWQNTDFTLCYKDPSLPVAWRGHFDPTKMEIYDFLEGIYFDIIESFDPPIFHMGNDEVRVSCWNSSASIQSWMANRGWTLSENDFMNLWGFYLGNALERLYRTFDSRKPVIVWSSEMTVEPYSSQFLDINRYIVQYWGDSASSTISNILSRGYKVIISNSDALYLDCGVGGWVNSGLNWCAPYRTWQKVYNNRFESMAGSNINQVLGAEVTIWSESIDEQVIDQRIWPRTSALAERLWTNPYEHWRSAEPRLLLNRKRLIENGGLAPEQLQPEWCLLRQGECAS